MFQLIGSVFKYSILVVTILVLSHIIEVKGVTVSQHVLNGMHWAAGYNPGAQAERMTSSISKSMEARVKQLDKIGDTAEVTPADQQALNKVIESSQFKKR